MTKYKEYFQRMINTNQEVFDEFRKVHALYDLDQDKWQEKFNTEGERIVKLVKEWENKLCKQSEKAGYGNYTGTLAEKFQSEVKKEFPLIDHVGLIIKKFTIKKINLE
ncbi:MAG: hypothetical protein ABIJ85_00295 [bacterium]